MHNAISHSKHEKILYAHRGANLIFPENSIEAFSHALKAGANALELDVHRTKDDIIVVFHDPSGIRVARENARVKDVSFNDIQHWRLCNTDTRVPTLEEVIRSFPSVPLNVDIKAHDLKTVKAVIEVVQAQNAQEHVRLTSESFKVTRLIRDQGYAGPKGLSMLEVAMIFFLPRFLLKKMNWQNHAVQIPQKFLIFSLNSSSFIKKCHQFGLRVDFWVINDNKTAKHLFELGADGIMTDNPSGIDFPPIISLRR